MPKSRPRLNLDIFNAEESGESGRVVPASPAVEPLKEKVNGSDRPLPPNGGQRSKFVPVGFYPEHLRLLDEAVLKLRQQGHWTASKSGIIRGLIEMNQDKLDTAWLDAR